METSRRTFLKAGLLSAALLAAGGGWYRATHPAAPRGFVLDGEARAALDAIVPALLAGAPPDAPADRARAVAASTVRVHQAILGLRPTGRIVRVRARHTVLAGGAIYTPALLLRSRVPDPSGQLGKRTFLHPTLVSAALFAQRVDGYAGAPRTVHSDHFLHTQPIDGPLGFKHAARAGIAALPFEHHLTRVVSAHVMGGCAMAGPDHPGVTGPDGRYRGLANLSVHDGSLFPTSIGANPQLSIHDITARLASDLAEALTGRPAARPRALT